MCIKVDRSDYTSLAAIQPFVQSNDFASGYYLYKYVSPTMTCSMAAISPMAAGTRSLWTSCPASGGAMSYEPTVVNEFGVQLDTQVDGAEGGAPAPAPTTVLVDDIWLE